MLPMAAIFLFELSRCGRFAPVYPGISGMDPVLRANKVSGVGRRPTNGDVVVGGFKSGSITLPAK